MVALSIALILIVAITISWDRFVIQLGKKTLQNDLQIVAFQVSDLLVSSTGTPENWESDPAATSSLGLASEDRILGTEKLTEFSDISSFDCSKIKNLLNIESFGFGFDIKPSPGFGTFPVTCDLPGNLKNNVATINRLVIINNNVYQAKISVWK